MSKSRNINVIMKHQRNLGEVRKSPGKICPHNSILERHIKLVFNSRKIVDQCLKKQVD